MKNIFTLLLIIIALKFLYNFEKLEYSSKKVEYIYIPFSGVFYKLLNYKVYKYGCIDIIYLKEKEIRNVSGYLGFCSVSRINENIKVLEDEENFIP